MKGNYECWNFDSSCTLASFPVWNLEKSEAHFFLLHGVYVQITRFLVTQAFHMPHSTRSWRDNPKKRNFEAPYFVICRSQWPSGLRFESAATRFVGLRVWIPPMAWMSLVSVVFSQLEVSASGWSLVQRCPTECGVSECDRNASTVRRPWPTRGGCTKGGEGAV
jgi:hypothetical protein